MSHSNFRAAAVIVAAGSGQRLGANKPKALVELAGVPLIVRAVRGIIDSGAVRTVVIAAPAAHLDEFHRLIMGDTKIKPHLNSEPTGIEILIVAGGATRQESVHAALQALPGDTTHALVHDAARCLTPPSVINSVADALKSGERAVIPALDVVDTIKTATTEDSLLSKGSVAQEQKTYVSQTLDRATLRAVQTPQGFELKTLRHAHSQPTPEAGSAGASDDAGMVEALGVPVRLVPGAQAALKITTPEDLQRAANFLPSQVQIPRTGIAIDVHPVNTGNDAPLCVAGLQWPDKPGLSGHSDGDVVAHAICDAVLSAAGLGDLGTHFGTADPKYAGAPGVKFLTETARLVQQAGFRIGNVSVQLIGPFPRLGARRAEAQTTLSEALGAPVHLSATTTDGLGFVGRGDGLAALATALVIEDP